MDVGAHPVILTPRCDLEQVNEEDQVDQRSPTSVEEASENFTIGISEVGSEVEVFTKEAFL